jgi:hypothetical protein
MAGRDSISHEDLHTVVQGEIDTHDTRFFSKEKGSGEHRSLWSAEKNAFMLARN